LLALFAPNTQQLIRYTAKVTEALKLPRLGLIQSLRTGQLALAPSPAIAILCGVLFAAAVARIWRPAIFIYFNF
jgi:hypothetical protein